jgi:subtilisin family serine protease
LRRVVVSRYDVLIDRDADEGGDLRNIRIQVLFAEAKDPWTIRLRNPHGTATVQYYAWTGPQGQHATLSGATQGKLTISDTGCCKSILTVGACRKRIPPNPSADEQITGFSGAGPTVDGRIKPEIVAVGDNISSTNSNQLNGYCVKSGTSMAAPLVAGAVALLFEEYHSLGHDLNQDAIKALLTQHANRLNLDLDPAQPTYDERERNKYGYGRLRLLEPIDYIRPPVEVDVWVRTADDDYGEEPFIGGCFCTSPDIKVHQPGSSDEITQLTWGTTYDVDVTVRNLGDDNAVGTTVRLKFALPWTAPNNWVTAQDAINNPLETTLTVNALNQVTHLPLAT